MRYLLDTHTFIWMAADPAKLSDTVREIVVKSGNNLLVSAASGWETALLWKLARIELPEEPAFFVPQIIQSFSLTPLNISFETAITAATLPFIHRDPFDRLLVATAMQENISLLSKDSMLLKYNISVIW